MAKQRYPVDSSDWLFRRSWAKPDKNYLNPDGTATSRVFKLREKDNGELSVDVKSLTTPERAIGDPAQFMLFELRVQTVVEIGLVVLHDPETQEEHGRQNSAHAVIIGMSMDDEISPGALARNSQRVFI